MIGNPSESTYGAPLGVDLVSRARLALLAFREQSARLDRAPAELEQSRSRIERIRAIVDTRLRGSERGSALARLDRLGLENQALARRVTGSVDLLESGRVKAGELAAAIASRTFGVTFLALALIVAGLVGITFAIARIVEAVAVHRGEVQLEADKLDAVLSGVLPSDVLSPGSPVQSQSDSGGILGSLKLAIPLVLAAVAIPSIAHMARGNS